LRDVALLILLGVFWGAVYPLTSLALRGFSPAAVVAGRTGLSAIILVPAAFRIGLIQAVREHPVRLAGGAVLQATLPVTLLTFGQQHAAAGIAAVILASQPVWAAVLTGFLDRALRPLELTGVTIGLAGIGLMSLTSGHAAASNAWALAALIAAAVSYATGAVYIQRVIPTIPPLITASAAMSLTAIVLLPITAATWNRSPNWASAGWLACLAVATGPALVLYYGLIRRTGPVQATLAGYLAPGFALLGAGLLGEALTTMEIAGLVLILTGSYLTSRTRLSMRTSEDDRSNPLDGP
jgi:drug/metabolite transporter (DMT)-like permease